jgi:hypothetical protein
MPRRSIAEDERTLGGTSMSMDGHGQSGYGVLVTAATRGRSCATSASTSTRSALGVSQAHRSSSRRADQGFAVPRQRRSSASPRHVAQRFRGGSLATSSRTARHVEDVTTRASSDVSRTSAGERELSRADQARGGLNGVSVGGRPGGNPSETGHEVLPDMSLHHSVAAFDRTSVPGASSAEESSSEPSSSETSKSCAEGTAAREAGAQKLDDCDDASERKLPTCITRVSSNTQTRNTGPFMQLALPNAGR